jgi:prepilin-type N-terminal cleavage/methylation domain-containing protein/prepilin-type processing-associated H-X9-DG protein
MPGRRLPSVRLAVWLCKDDDWLIFQWQRGGLLVRRQSRAGFTLVEVLVSIAIIAILTGMSMFGLLPARRKAQGAVCRSNLRLCGLALGLYAQDNDERLPLADGAGNQPGILWSVPEDTRAGTPDAVRKRRSTCFNSIQPYVKNHGIFRCPACTEEAVGSAPAQKYLITYTFNGLASGAHLAAVPPDCILVWEGNGNRAYPSFTLVNPVLPNGQITYPPPPQPEGPPYDCTLLWPNEQASTWVHDKGSNYLYADGRVRKVSGTDIRSSPFSDIDEDTGRPYRYWLDRRDGCAWLFRPKPH